MTVEIPLNPVERVEVLTVIDNVADALLTNTEVAKRLGVAGREMDTLPQIEAPLLEAGRAADVPVAEHGLSFLVSITNGDARRSVLFDTGSTVDGLAHNLRVLGVNPGEIEAIVLSHGHFDHTTGLNGLSKGPQPLPPLVVHPDFWLRRRIALPGREPYELPTTSEEKVRAAGFSVVERCDPSLLLDGGLLVTGEIERTTEFERGFAVHQAFRDGEWQPDPLIHDDQALVANVRGRGLVVITGCGTLVSSTRCATPASSRASSECTRSSAACTWRRHSLSPPFGRQWRRWLSWRCRWWSPPTAQGGGLPTPWRPPFRTPSSPPA